MSRKNPTGIEVACSCRSSGIANRCEACREMTTNAEYHDRAAREKESRAFWRGTETEILEMLVANGFEAESEEDSIARKKGQFVPYGERTIQDATEQIKPSGGATTGGIVKICPSCGTSMESDQSECPECGWEPGEQTVEGITRDADDLLVSNFEMLDGPADAYSMMIINDANDPRLVANRREAPAEELDLPSIEWQKTW